MNNNTERLKNYWKSKDFTFVATYKKVNKNTGFFNYFMNPVSKMKLYYPSFDEVEVLDKRVSFYFHGDKELIDGDFYKVELVHTENPKGKNNPFSLNIKSVSHLNQIKVKKLLEERKKDVSESESYFGNYSKASEKFASFNNVMLSESGEILMSDGESQKVFVSPNIALKEHSYYLFSIRTNEGKLPNAIPNTIKELELNPYQDFIRLRFERLNNPEANKMIANLMREIGKGMYSSKQRMIFELLQNADDAPGKEKVEFHIDINGDYFFVMHDGAPFNKDDVEAITSAAESTKRGDSKKTGYKGIGFKSVFTDSTEVWLKSGGYQFAFLRNSRLFEDFDNFYFSGERYKKYPELLKEDKLKFRNQRLRFNGSKDIPWQVIPVWQDNLPSEFSDSNFNNFNNPVQFALKLGEKNISDYKTAIENITKRPQFLLFLRNTSKFRSPKNGVTVTRTDTGNVIEIEKNKVIYVNSEKEQHQDIFHYTKQTFGEIAVSDEAFFELGIGLKKQSKINDYNEISYYFTDLNDREIETIPPKLASVTETEISFGISLIDNKISPEQEYINGLSKYSSLFTYLPMEDTRFQLPFLVNADFVPSSDRQNIQGDNLWNKYIMIKVAEKHVATLSHYALEFIKDNNQFSSYLSLLLKEPLPEDDTAQQIIDSYNEKYIEQLNIVSIVVNDKNQSQLLSETIFDTSGLIELFGHEIFYEIIETQKRLPHSNLDANYLKEYDYLDIEVINLEELANSITPEICERFGVIIAEKSIYKKPELLKWLDKLVGYMPNNFGKIPFIIHNNSLFSLERLVAEDNAWLINKNTNNYEELFKSLGYHTINLNLHEYSNINTFLLSYSGYINDKTLAYERIATNSNLSSLDISLKLNLVDFLQNSEFMVGIGETKYFGELKLFVDKNGMARPLRQLLNRNINKEVNSIQPFKIIEQEFLKLSDELQRELISKEEVFTSFILNTKLFEEWSQQFNSQNIDNYIGNIKTIYSWVENEDEISSSDWASIPWLYVDDELRFTNTDEVFWSSAFHNLSNENYETVKSILQIADLRTLPIQNCGEIIQTFKLKTDDSSSIDWTKVNNLELLSANTFLDWLENDGVFSEFFKEYTLESNGKSLWSIVEVEDTQVFDGSNKELNDYINSIEELKSRFTELDKSLCSENRSKIGLLQGDKLLSAIINSKVFDQNLATLLQSNLSWEQLNDFISNLPVFNLKTGVEYGNGTTEHIIIYHILKSVVDIKDISNDALNVIENLRDKIEVNQNPLSVYDLSNRIQFGTGENKKILKLSGVLEEFKGESDVLDDLIESFGAIKEKAKLRKLIFKTRQMPLFEIHSKIEEEANTYYSVQQVVFQLLDKAHGGNRNWSKQHFGEYWNEQENEIELQSSYKSFLAILIDINFTELGGFHFHDLVLENCLDKNYTIDSEIIPQWLEEWLHVDQNKRIAYIEKLGYNGLDSPIVKLRKESISDNYEQNTLIRYFEESKPNEVIIWNTIEWLSKFSSKKITRNIELLNQINNYVSLDTDTISAIFIPIIESVSQDQSITYKLQSVALNSELYVINDDEENTYSIFSSIKRENENSIFIDNNCGNVSTYFNAEEINLNVSVDLVLLEEESKLWDEPFYQKWEYNLEYPVYIYNGNEIPYLRTFNGITIDKFTNDLKVENESVYFISIVLKNDILNNLPLSFPKDKLDNLKEWHYKTLQNESLLDEDSFDYKENIDRLLQDRLGISEEDQKRESGNAKTHAVYFLDENDFDVSNVNNAGAALTNIIDPDGNEVDCIVRSAKGGLLYLDKEHWDMLEDNLMYLIVIYPGNNPRLFKNRLELLEEELSENVLFRVPNNKHTNEIDGVFNALESESHLILVTSEKMKESLFSKLKQKGDFNKEENTAVGGEDFTL